LQTAFNDLINRFKRQSVRKGDNNRVTYAQSCVCRVREPINPEAIKLNWGRRLEDAWRRLVVELLREAAGRNKGREEGDVQAFGGGMDAAGL
jgi:hypothetical protein